MADQLGAHGQGAAAVAGCAQGPVRRDPHAAALCRPHRQPAGSRDGAHKGGRAALDPRDARRARLHRGRDPHAAVHPRRGGGPALPHAPQRVRPADVTAHRDRAAAEAARRRRRREGLRDGAGLSQRGYRLHAPPRVLRARGLRRLPRLRRRWPSSPAAIVLSAVGAVAHTGHRVVTTREFDLGQPWPRISVYDVVAESPRRASHPGHPGRDPPHARSTHGVTSRDAWGSGELVLEVFEKLVEHTIMQPTFVVDYPVRRPSPARTVPLTEKWDLVVTASSSASPTPSSSTP